MALIRTVFVALAVICSVQMLEGALVKRDTSSTSDLESAISTLGNVLSDGWSNLTSAISSHLPSHDTVTSQLHNHTLNLARTLGDYVGQLQNQASSHSGDLQNVLQQVASKWNETATNLQSTDINKSAQELQQQAHQSFNSFLEEARKLSQAVGTSEANQNVRNVANEAITRVQELANEFRNSLHTATSH